MITQMSLQTIYLKDYCPPDYQIQSVDLHFDLHEDHCLVTNQMRIKRVGNKASSLPLNGEHLKLESIKLNGQVLRADQFEVDERLLVIYNTPEEFQLEIKTCIFPQNNTALVGLYKSGGMFCTQNEAQGFRRITYYLDRPDVMSVFTTTIEANRSKYPILLSNGNLISTGEMNNGRHWAKWNDPFKKPCYLYALVAGDLGKIQDSFITRSGRTVKLEIYCDKGNENRCYHAMDSLKKSMKWDEDVFGREYDLDIFMIVAVSDFNAGAMENKGLNIFNSKYVLADPSMATDFDYEHIEGVIGHEYFHNWTGNRITCRDWFQLSLKEGLTVFRDQEFSSDMGSRAVKRIDDVIKLRTMQFAEDAGPMAHPVRPTSYIEVNNFYTLTVYEKGAEVIRMIHTLLGPKGFRKGMDKYFELYDGMAVTTDDFVHAMEIANNVNLTQFKLWYDQAGTPEIEVQRDYDPKAKKYRLQVRQSCPPTPESATKKPFHIPISMGLMDPETGRELAGGVLQLKKEVEEFTFSGIERQPIPSILRGFSAPVKLNIDLSNDELMFLLANDSDSFNRWEAGQQLMQRQMLKLISARQKGIEGDISTNLLEAFRQVLINEKLEPAFRAQALSIPPESYFTQLMEVVDVDAIHFSRDQFLTAVASRLKDDLAHVMRAHDSPSDRHFNAQAAGHRSLKNLCLEYMVLLGDKNSLELGIRQLKNAKNMTDELAALVSLSRVEGPDREIAMQIFYEKWKSETLVMNKWLTVQATSPFKSTLKRVKQLLHDPVYDSANPNKIYSLQVALGQNNPFVFHDISGEGYKFVADQVLEVDSKNPQVAARLVGVFNHWKKFDSQRQTRMRTELERILANPKLSKNVYEIVAKGLGKV